MPLFLLFFSLSGLKRIRYFIRSLPLRYSLTPMVTFWGHVSERLAGNYSLRTVPILFVRVEMEMAKKKKKEEKRKSPTVRPTVSWGVSSSGPGKLGLSTSGNS